MHEAERDRAACAMARYYLNPTAASLRPTSLAGGYHRLILSAQNRGMSPGVIGGAIGGVDALAPILSHFDPHRVHLEYGDDSGKVLDDIVRTLKPRGKIRETPGIIRPLFCRSIVSGAAFLSQFKDSDEFFDWASTFDRDDRLRPALPLLLSLELEGFGFPLACDFLKELGYLDFAKPDVHLKTVLKRTGLGGQRANDYEVFKAVTRIARHEGVSAYHVDKLFWLVGSGFFYDHPAIGREGRIPTDRRRFIELASATPH